RDRLTAPGAGNGSPEVAGQRVHHILIVDDEEQLRDYCKMVLESDQLHCAMAPDGAAALAALRNGPFDLVLMDWEMPNLSGPEACQRIRQSPPSPNLKIILLSGHVPADILAQYLLAGADDFLPKPFSFTQLRARVRAALRLKDAQDRSDQLVHHLLTL